MPTVPTNHPDFPIGLKVKGYTWILYHPKHGPDNLGIEVIGIIGGISRIWLHGHDYVIILDTPLEVPGSAPWLTALVDGRQITPLTLGQFL